MFYTDLCSVLVSRFSISDNNDDVRHVAAVACRWCQQRRTDTGKRSVRISATFCLTEWQDRCLECCDWRVGCEIKHGWDGRTEFDKTHACIAAVDIQSADKTRKSRLHPGKVRWTDTRRIVHDKNYVSWWIYNRNTRILYGFHNCRPKVPEFSVISSDRRNVFLLIFCFWLRYDTIAEFNVESKAEYSALPSTRSQKKKLKQTTPVPL